MARVLMVTSEAAPFVKTGGLADVLGSLPAALIQQKHEVAVLLPRYRQVQLDAPERVYHDLTIWLGLRSYPAAVDRVVRNGVQYLFLDCPTLFDRDGIYMDAEKLDFPDNHIRFAAFSRAALEVARRVFRPQVIHCHDWQAALVPVYIRRLFATDPTFIGTKLLFTIHNMGYQGIFGSAAFRDIGLDLSLFTPATLEFWGNVNFMKGGIIFSDAINTVSPSYAREIQTPDEGFGLDVLLRSRSDVLSGILNGVDYGDWDPEIDHHIPAKYSSEALEGKAACKAKLLEELEMSADNIDRPVLGIVSRFTAQKGFDLIAGAASELMAENVGLAVLGSSSSQDEARFEDLFRDLRATYPDRVGLKIGYDNGLAHRIEAGSDIFLMPSHYEPCGLNQMYSLRYGTPPVVRATGGLNDTIDPEVGFKFYDYSSWSFMDSVRQAVSAWRDRDAWVDLMRAGMARDYSWNRSARCYGELYDNLLAGKAAGQAV